MAGGRILTKDGVRPSFLLIAGSLRFPVRLYIDNAKMYRSRQLARIAASIGTLIIHSRPYQPEGRGKIERCFRALREQFLADLDPKRLLSLDELNDRLQAWIDSYHPSEHSTIGTTSLLAGSAISNTCASFRPPPTCAGFSFIVSIGWCLGILLSC